jgi:2-polyprenyl-3-methyl-5-hydroxy-6-metoxy-1,4-benzoquinol methylase
MAHTEKDFSYESRERQTATKFEDIREDHSLRYQVVPLVSPELMSHKPTAILDVFCGNGYGTWFLAKEFGCSIFGIDGSAEAIDVANQHFSLPNNFFSSKIFPFNLPEATYDIITCFESIEHIDDPEGFFASLAKSLKPNGLLYVSTPNEKVMSLTKNAYWFNHHTKHFTDEEMIALGEEHNLELQLRCGQDAYLMIDGFIQSYDDNAAIVPNVELENPQFFIHIYKKLLR